MRSSENHTESHHLIRCLAPAKDDDALSSTERRLISLEDQLKNMQPRFDNLQSRFDNMQSQLDNVQSRFDDLTQDITTRIGNMEQLLHRLAAAMTAGSSA
jgi:chaperonin cofactor prefoldin